MNTSKISAILAAAAMALAISLPTSDAGAIGLGPIKVPHIKIPSIPHLPTLPGLGPLEHPTGDLAVTIIKFRGEVDDFARGLVPAVNIPGIGKVNNFDAIEKKILTHGAAELDHALAKLGELTGLPIPSRGKLAPGVGAGFALTLWKSKRLKAACVLAGKSCGPLMTRLAQTAVESNPTRGQFCKVMIGVADNRKGFGHGFNGMMTRNVHGLVPDTQAVAVDFRKPHCE